MADEDRGQTSPLERFGELSRQLNQAGLKSWLNVMFGNAFYVAFGALTSWILANALSPSDFGLLSLALAILFVAQESCGSGIDVAMVRLAAEHATTDAARSNAVYRATFRLKLVLSLMVGGAFLLVDDWIATDLFGDPRLKTLIHWVILGLAGGTLYNYALARFQAEERFRLFAAFRAANGGIRVAGLTGLWLLGSLELENAMGVTMSSFWLSFFLAVLVLRSGGSHHETKQVRGVWKDVLRFGRWVVLSHLLFALYSRIDTLLLGYFRTAEEVGIYAVAWNITFLMDLSTYSLITSLLPRASRLRGSEALVAHTRRTLALSSVIALALAPLYFASGPLIRALFPEYGEAADVFHILFWGPLITLLVHPLYLVLYTRHRASQLVWADLGLVVFTAMGSWLLIPEFGWRGAAYTTVAARVWSCLLVLYLVRRELQVPAREPEDDDPPVKNP